jgi:hypothetical protein
MYNILIWLYIQSSRFAGYPKNVYKYITLNEYDREGLSLHCNENAIYIFLFWELRGLSPNFHIHVSVSDLYIPRIATYFLKEKRQDDRGNI